jgi:hypothetical protein
MSLSPELLKARPGPAPGLAAQTVEQRRRQVAFGKGRDDDDDLLAGIFRALADADAAVSAAPEETPTGRPSSFATRRAISKASSLVTLAISS